MTDLRLRFFSRHQPYRLHVWQVYYLTSISGTPKRVGDEFCFNFWGEDCGNVALETRVLPWVEKAGMNHHFPLTTENPMVVTLHKQHNMPT